jgi:hypothetical protein
MRVNGLIDLNRILAIITILSVIGLFGVNVLAGMSMISPKHVGNGAILYTS